MRRRDFISGIAGSAAAWPLTALSEISARRPIIAFLGSASPETGARSVNGLLRGMQEFGYVEGRDFEMVYRFSYGDGARVMALAKEVVDLNPSVIVAIPSFVARSVTATIPIVSAVLPANSIQLGMIASVPRPGGNVTGMMLSVEGLPGKWLQLARELVPGATRIGLLFNPNTYQLLSQRADVEQAASSVNVKIVSVGVQARTEFDNAFHALAQERVEAMIVHQDALFFNERKRLSSLAAATRLPAVYGFREYVDDGGLISYGIDLYDSHRRAAGYVVKILKGSKAGDLPLEFPTKLELVVNLKTAKSLGLEVPASILLRADEVIE